MFVTSELLFVCSTCVLYRLSNSTDNNTTVGLCRSFHPTQDIYPAAHFMNKNQLQACFLSFYSILIQKLPNSASKLEDLLDGL